MLHLHLRYLTGYVAASGVSDRREVEWPPHPGRVFLALAAAYFESGGDAAERAALEWLERQAPPRLHAGECSRRHDVTSYVPVNDRAGPSRTPLPGFTGLARERQPRVFARAHLDAEFVSLHWPDAEPGPHRVALDRLSEKVGRLGHSTSLVQLLCDPLPPASAPNWTPTEDDASEWFRVPHPGLLTDLEARYAGGPGPETAPGEPGPREKPVVPLRWRPDLPRAAGYRRSGDDGSTPEDVLESVFDPRLLVFEMRPEDGRTLDMAATLRLTRRLRGAFLARLGDAGASEQLTGHRGHGRAILPHLAFLGLPAAETGGIAGAALVAPRSLPGEERRRLLGVIAELRRDELCLGSLGRWRLEALDPGSPRSLHPRTWTRQPTGARRWGTVTPFVLDRHSSARDVAAYQAEIVQGVRGSCLRIGLPEPDEVWISRISGHPGAPAAHEFPRLRRKDGSELRQIHVGLRFARPIIGPVLVGAGRFRGYGLCRPLPDDVA